MEKFYPHLGVIARVFLGLIFVGSAVGKLQGYAGFEAYMEAGGLPGLLAPFVIAFELVAGLAVIIGFRAKIAALALAGFTLLAALMFHLDFADQVQSAMFMKNLAIAGGLILLFIHGAGAYSMDKK